MSAENTNINHPRDKDAGDREYLVGVDGILSAALEHEPAAVVVSLGFDALASDPAMWLSVTEEAFEKVRRLRGGTYPTHTASAGGRL
jgi:acetoin utilization deacetylase AcuC-like enzyme